ncbi:MAG TPA: hypothetical protein VGF43_19880 [Dongiaceae bacterium]
MARPATWFDPAVLPVERLAANDLKENADVHEVASRCRVLHGRAGRVAAE